MLFMAARSAGVTPKPNENIKCTSSLALDQPWGESSIGHAACIRVFRFFFALAASG